MVYLDNGATTRPFPNKYNNWLNSNSSYTDDDRLIYEAKERIKACINGYNGQIIFTSGGCEGNTFCINNLYNILGRPVICSKFEHKSIINNPRTICSRYDLDSCMGVNNETGELFNVPSIHKDLVQALGKIDIDIDKLKCDMATFSGHKIHANKGIGFVWVSNDMFKELKPLIYGGQQEFGMRGGTSDVSNVLYMADCVEMVCSKRHLRKGVELRGNDN